jgi:hypothetical protein
MLAQVTMVTLPTPSPLSAGVLSSTDTGGRSAVSSDSEPQNRFDCKFQVSNRRPFTIRKMARFRALMLTEPKLPLKTDAATPISVSPGV